MREWETWQEIHKDNHNILNNCIGFLYGVNVNNVPYIKNLVFYTVDFSYDEKSYRTEKHPKGHTEAINRLFKKRYVCKKCGTKMYSGNAGRMI